MRHPNRKPQHPGKLLREVALPALPFKKTQVAQHLGISRSMLYAILEERSSVSVDIALRLGKYLGNGANFWINKQRAYDVWQAEQATDLSNVPVAEDLISA